MPKILDMSLAEDQPENKPIDQISWETSRKVDPDEVKQWELEREHQKGIEDAKKRALDMKQLGDAQKNDSIWDWFSGWIMPRRGPVTHSFYVTLARHPFKCRKDTLAILARYEFKYYKDVMRQGYPIVKTVERYYEYDFSRQHFTFFWKFQGKGIK